MKTIDLEEFNKIIKENKDKNEILGVFFECHSSYILEQFLEFLYNQTPYKKEHLRGSTSKECYTLYLTTTNMGYDIVNIDSKQARDDYDHKSCYVFYDINVLSKESYNIDDIFNCLDKIEEKLK